MNSISNIMEDGDGMKHIVKLHTDDGITELQAQDGANLFEFLRKHGCDVHAPCGGKGKCGKCLLKVEGVVSQPSRNEMMLLGSKKLEQGYRISCLLKVDSDIDVFFEADKNKAIVKTVSMEGNTHLDPLIKKRYVELSVPSLDDNLPDAERIIDKTGLKLKISQETLSDLSRIIRKDNFKITCIESGSKLVSVESGNTTQKIYALAVDIGTTTVAAHLVDLKSGGVKAAASFMNPQRKYGHDVISRARFTMEKEEGLITLHREIIDAVNICSEELSNEAQISTDDIYMSVFTGNTIMMHLLLNFTVANIASSPFIPVTTLRQKVLAKDIGLKINKDGFMVVLPCLSSYIGADTLCAVLASGMHESRNMNLLVDIGTNGEIVLGDKKSMYACSTAAGPAFEGAGIRCGMGGVPGAVDRVSFEPQFSFTAIGNIQPEGICGSGVIDTLAGLLSCGLMDSSGKITDSNNKYSDKITDIDGIKSFLIADGVFITQKDIREIQSAKAAIEAGINVLIKNAGISYDDIEKVYLAGSFGNSLNPVSAASIGLIPKELAGRIESIGNAAGEGVVMAAKSFESIKKLEKIKKRMRYVELSSEEGYTEEYVNCMSF
ncbi:MAG TPA: ASKHA domain-containing protein [Clostridia bacterium]